MRSGHVYPVPFARLVPPPTQTDRIREAYIDRELANEAITYILESGAEGVVHIEQALEYIEEDELVEVTPKNIRIRCKHLDPNKRKMAAKG